MASPLNSSVYCRFGTSFSDIQTSVQTEISKFLLYVKSRQGHHDDASSASQEHADNAAPDSLSARLPPEVREKILVNLPSRDRVFLTQTNGAWNEHGDFRQAGLVSIRTSKARTEKQTEEGLKIIETLPIRVRDQPLRSAIGAFPNLPLGHREKMFVCAVKSVLKLEPTQRADLLTALIAQMNGLGDPTLSTVFKDVATSIKELPRELRGAPMNALVLKMTFLNQRRIPAALKMLMEHAQELDALPRSEVLASLTKALKDLRSNELPTYCWALSDAILKLPEEHLGKPLGMLIPYTIRLQSPDDRAKAFGELLAAARTVPEEQRGRSVAGLCEAQRYLTTIRDDALREVLNEAFKLPPGQRYESLTQLILEISRLLPAERTDAFKQFLSSAELLPEQQRAHLVKLLVPEASRLPSKDRAAAVEALYWTIATLPESMRSTPLRKLSTQLDFSPNHLRADMFLDIVGALQGLGHAERCTVLQQLIPRVSILSVNERGAAFGAVLAMAIDMPEELRSTTLGALALEVGGLNGPDRTAATHRMIDCLAQMSFQARRDPLTRLNRVIADLPEPDQEAAMQRYDALVQRGWMEVTAAAGTNRWTFDRLAEEG